MKIELKVPESLNEITLKQYQKYYDVVQNNTDAMFISQKMIEIFCNVSLANVVKMPVNTILELNEHFKNIFEKERAFKNRFKLDTIDFGFIPNLEEISLEEFIDIEMYLQKFEDLHKALAILYRPIKDSKKDLYTIHDKDYGQRFEEVLRYTPLDIALEAQVFFYNLGNELLKAIPQYLAKEMKKIQKTSQQKDNLTKSGDGIIQSMNYQMETLQNSMKLLSKAYINHLHF
jgi:hypothetical protein